MSAGVMTRRGLIRPALPKREGCPGEARGGLKAGRKAYWRFEPQSAPRFRAIAKAAREAARETHRSATALLPARMPVVLPTQPVARPRGASAFP